jgi:hypothetical protein
LGWQVFLLHQAQVSDHEMGAIAHQRSQQGKKGKHKHGFCVVLLKVEPVSLIAWFRVISSASAHCKRMSASERAAVNANDPLVSWL